MICHRTNASPHCQCQGSCHPPSLRFLFYLHSCNTYTSLCSRVLQRHKNIYLSHRNSPYNYNVLHAKHCLGLDFSSSTWPVGSLLLGANRFQRFRFIPTFWWVVLVFRNARWTTGGIHLDLLFTKSSDAICAVQITCPPCHLSRAKNVSGARKYYYAQMKLGRHKHVSEQRLAQVLACELGAVS